MTPSLTHLSPPPVASPHAKRNSTFLTDTVEEEAGEEARQDILQPAEVESLAEERADRLELILAVLRLTPHLRQARVHHVLPDPHPLRLLHHGDG